MNSDAKTSMIGRRELLVGGLMALTSGLAYARTPTAYVPPLRQADFEAAVPKAVGEWRYAENGSVVLPPPDALRDRLYDDLLTRTYLNPRGEALMLVMAYKNVQDGIVQVHRPEVCYPASGFVLENEWHGQMVLNDHVVPVKAFSARRADRIEQVLYFTRLGARFPLSWREQRWAVLDANLAGDVPDGLLTRVSIVQNDQSSAITQMISFLQTLAHTGKPQIRSVLTGTQRKS